MAVIIEHKVREESVCVPVAERAVSSYCYSAAAEESRRRKSVKNKRR
ncbi:MAG: hypothetical protein M3136_04995 [Thermoproteota archaeon]|nr:hypothetical protein [Thermoproteota archaeon]